MIYFNEKIKYQNYKKIEQFHLIVVIIIIILIKILILIKDKNEINIIKKLINLFKILKIVGQVKILCLFIVFLINNYIV